MPGGNECEEEAKFVQQMMLDLGFQGRTGRKWSKKVEEKHLDLLLLLFVGTFNIFHVLAQFINKTQPIAWAPAV